MTTRPIIQAALSNYRHGWIGDIQRWCATGQFCAHGKHSLPLRQYQTADIRLAQKSAADSNVERTPHRPAIFIASNAWSHEHRFVVEPLGFRARAALNTTRSQNCSKSSPQTVHESEATSYVQFGREWVHHHPPSAPRVRRRNTPPQTDALHVGHGGRKTRQRSKGENQLPKIAQGVTFTKGVEVTDNASTKRRPIAASPNFKGSL